jgi:hypothetical protein
MEGVEHAGRPVPQSHVDAKLGMNHGITISSILAELFISVDQLITQTLGLEESHTLGVAPWKDI